MLIIRGLADSFYGGCLIQRDARQANYSPYYKKSATVGVNYSLTITLSMVLKRGAINLSTPYFLLSYKPENVTLIVIRHVTYVIQVQVSYIIVPAGIIQLL